MGNILFNNNSLILCLIAIIFTALETFIQNKIITKILKTKDIRNECIIQIITISIIRILLPIPYYKILEAIFYIIMYKKVLSISIEKALYVAVTNIINSSIIGLIVIKLTNVNLSNTISLIYFCIISVLMYIGAYLSIRKLKVSIDMPEYLSTNTKKQIIQICIVSLILITIDNIEILLFIKEIPNIIYLLNLVLLIACYNVSNKSIRNILELEKEENKIRSLEGNNDRLLKNYDNISSFKHDFENIMLGIGGYITTKDIEGLQKMYQDMFVECKEIENDKSFNEKVINNPAVYNLINTKYLKAKKDDVKINLEVYLDLSTLKIKTYELCRILGILIDNAIEAAKECEDKIISIKFIKDNYNNRNLIVIENSCKNYLVDMNKIKQKGFTTKKNKMFHGIGLWKVNQIIKKNENLRLYTSRDKMFKQQLEIYSWD